MGWPRRKEIWLHDRPYLVNFSVYMDSVIADPGVCVGLVVIVGR